MSHSHPKQSGFTLLELLVVMVIIGLLAGYVGPKYFGQIGKSEVKVARAQLDALDKALDQYHLDTGHYPATAQGLNALMKQAPNEPKRADPTSRKMFPLIRGARLISTSTPASMASSTFIPTAKTDRCAEAAKRLISSTGSV